MAEGERDTRLLDDTTLLQLYQIHAEEVRFQIKVTWDRTQYFFVLSLGLTTLGGAIWKDQQDAVGLGLASAAFFAGTLVCLLARAAMQKGHEYYRISAMRRAELERLLGLRCVTSSCSSKSAQIVLASTDSTRRLLVSGDNNAFIAGPLFRKKSINSYQATFFLIIGVLNFLAGLHTAWKSLGLAAPSVNFDFSQASLGHLVSTIVSGLALILSALSLHISYRVIKRLEAVKTAETPQAPYIRDSSHLNLSQESGENSESEADTEKKKV